MKKVTIIKLTVVAVVTVLGAVALIMYSGNSFAQVKQETQQVATQEPVEIVDSVALSRGLAELQKIVAHYEQASLQVSGEIRYYEGDSTATTLADKARFTFAVDEERSMYELDSVVTITEAAMALIIDKKEESIAIAEKNEEEMKATEAMPQTPAALMAMRPFIKDIITSETGQYRKLTIVFNGDAPFNIMEYVIEYDPKNYAIRKIRIEMTDSQLADEVSTNTGADAKVTEDDELFIVDSANNAIPTGLYADVKLVAYEIVYMQERPIQKGSVTAATYVRSENGEIVPVARYKNYSILY